MKIVFDKDTYVASTWGAADHFVAGEPKEVGKDFGVLCLQQGAKEYNESKVEVVKEAEPQPKKARGRPKKIKTE